MIDIGSYYYFASAYDYYDLYRWNPSDRYVFHYQNMSHGVRPVVVLKQGVKFADDGKDGSSEDNALNLVAT